MSRKTVWIIVPALLTLVCAVAQAQTPASTAFSYQGQLKLNNVPLNNTADFIFKLFDAADGGTQIGADLTVANVSVSKGLFAVQPDFGASAFAGDARWLDIQVRSPAGSGTYTPLSPRQELTPTPYSSCAAKAAPNAITSAMLTNDADSLRKVSADMLTCNPPLGFVGVNTADPGSTDCFFRVKAWVNEGWGGMDMTTTGPGTNPYYILRDGGGHAACSWLNGQTGDWNLSMTGGVQALTVTGNGNVGIGTTDPWDALHVAGGIRVGAMTDGPLDSPGYGDTLSFSGGPDVSPSYNSDNSDPLWIARYNVADNSTELRVNVGDDLGQAQDKFVVGVSSPDWHPLLSVGADGNVGIGTDTPWARLNVVGTTLLSRSDVGGGQLLVDAGVNDDSIYLEGCNHDGMGSASGMFLTGRFGVPMPRLELRADTVVATGNVGIGTNNPQYKLDVSATARFSSSIWHGAYGVSTAYNGYGLYGAANSGSVAAGVCGSSNSGIGVYGVSQGVNGEGVRGECHSGAAAKGIYGISNSGRGVVGVSNATSGTGVYGLASASSGSPVGGMFESDSPTGYAGYFVGRSYFNGNVGIGTSAPQAKLDVAGDMAFSGSQSRTIGCDSRLHIQSAYDDTLYLNPWGGDVYVGGGGGSGHLSVGVLTIYGGADLAEPFVVSRDDATQPQSDEAVEPGMVVVIDPDRPGQLKLATAAYDQKVAGVISGANDVQPGMVMSGLKDAATKTTGEAATGEHAVALTGRVWCWCDATYAAITPGDRLTTSTTSGHAMKATDSEQASGAVIGKAMTRLENGKGLVLVLVQPQ